MSLLNDVRVIVGAAESFANRTTAYTCNVIVSEYRHVYGKDGLDRSGHQAEDLVSQYRKFVTTEYLPSVWLKHVAHMTFAGDVPTTHDGFVPMFDVFFGSLFDYIPEDERIYDTSYGYRLAALQQFARHLMKQIIPPGSQPITSTVLVPIDVIQVYIDSVTIAIERFTESITLRFTCNVLKSAMFCRHIESHNAIPKDAYCDGLIELYTQFVKKSYLADKWDRFVSSWSIRKSHLTHIRMVTRNGTLPGRPTLTLDQYAFNHFYEECFGSNAHAARLEALTEFKWYLEALLEVSNQQQDIDQ